MVETEDHDFRLKWPLRLDSTRSLKSQIEDIELAD